MLILVVTVVTARLFLPHGKAFADRWFLTMQRYEIWKWQLGDIRRYYDNLRIFSRLFTLVTVFACVIALASSQSMGLKNILWHLHELSMALRLVIYGTLISYLWHFCTRITRIIFLHTDLTELTDFIRFIRGAKNILWNIDERVGCGNWIHGIDGIGMRCDTWQMWHWFLRTFSLYYFLFKIYYLFFLRAREDIL